jgi:6-phosphofructokinase 1
LEAVAKETKSMPDNFISGAHDVSTDFKNYARPLMGDLPMFERIHAPAVKKILKKQVI